MLPNFSFCFRFTVLNQQMITTRSAMATDRVGYYVFRLATNSLNVRNNNNNNNNSPKRDYQYVLYGA